MKLFLNGLIGFVCLTFSCLVAGAGQCDAVFTNGVASNGTLMPYSSTHGELRIDAGARVYNTPSTELDFSSMIYWYPDGQSCDSADCSISGQEAGAFSLPAFPTFSGDMSANDAEGIVLGEGAYPANHYWTVYVKDANGDNLPSSFSDNHDVYYIQTLGVTENAELNLAAGKTYYIETLYVNAGASITVTGSGVATVYVKNMPWTDGDIYGITADATLNMLLYAGLGVNVNSDLFGAFYVVGQSHVVGDITGQLSTGSLYLESSSSLTFQDIPLDGFDPSCAQVNTDPVLYYEFEQGDIHSAGSVIDSSANQFDGMGLNDALTLLSDEQKSCRALWIPNNSDTTRDAVDSTMLAHQIGSQGTISFWYKSEEAWNSGTPRTLFDASTYEPSSPDPVWYSKYFFLAKTASGGLQFGMEDRNDVDFWEITGDQGFAANVWVHIAVTWDTQAGDAQIYVNGVEQTTSQRKDSGYGTAIPVLNNLYIGDNRTDYIPFESSLSHNSAYGQFDGFRVYEYQQDSAAIQTDMAAVSECALQLAHYQFEEEVWSTTGAIEDVITPAYNATALGNAVPLFPAGQKSCQVMDVPYNGDSNVAGMDTSLDINDIGSAGTISFWYRADNSWSDGRYKVLLDATQAGSPNMFFLALINKTGGIYIAITDSQGNTMQGGTANQSVPAGRWVHIAISWDASSGQIKVRLDGQDQSSNTSVGSGFNYTLGDFAALRVGDSRYTYSVYNGSGYEYINQSANGQFDDLRVFPFVQSDAEIQQDMADVSPCQRPMAVYRFEQTSWISAGDVTDSSGNDRHGSPKSLLAQPTYPDEQVSCRAFDVPSEFSESDASVVRNTRHAVDTEIDVNDIGGTGTISFWYRANTAWNSGSASRTLFDATTNAGRYFYLSLGTSGQLEFGLEDTADGDFYATSAPLAYAAGDWVHVAVSWDIPGRQIQFILNGEVDTGSTQYRYSGFNDQLAELNTLYIGDSRSDQLCVNCAHSHYSADGQFDDVRVYNYVQTSSEVQTDINTVTECEGLAAFYQFEQDQWSGLGTVLDSSGNDIHGDNNGAIEPVYTSPQKSCRAMYVPDNRSSDVRDYMDTNIEVNDLGSQGSISFWYKSEEDWSTAGRSRVLFEANEYSRRFMLYVSATGVLQGEITDSHLNVRTFASDAAFAFAADRWAHIALTWDVHNNSVKLYVDGNEVTLTDNGVNLSTDLASFRTIQFGDNTYTIPAYSPVPNSAAGHFDDIRVYYFAQSEAQINSDMSETTPCAYVNHYQLSFAGTAYTCGPAQLTLQACMSEDCSVLYDGTVFVSLDASAGTLASHNLSFVGSSSTTVSHSVEETVTFSLNSASPSAPLNCLVDGSLAACDMVFTGAELALSWQQADPYQAIPEQDSQVAFASSLHVSVPDACDAQVSGQGLLLAVQCDNPASCQANQLQLNGSTISNPEQYSATGLTFDSSGEVAIPAGFIRYDDAGQIRIAAKTSDDSASGASNAFVVVPQLRLTPSLPATPIAGALYPMQLDAIGALEQITPNYQPGQLQSELIKVLPASGSGVHGQLVWSNSSVSGAVSISSQDAGSTSYQLFSNSVANFTLGQSVGLQNRYSEVGTLQSHFIDSSYLGTTVPAYVEQSLGRYIPAYFALSDNNPALAHSDGSFSYIGRQLSFVSEPQLTFTPFNALGDSVQNYIDSLMRLTTPGSIAADDIVFSEGSGFSGSVTVEEGTWYLPTSGLAIMGLADAHMTYLKSATPSAPFDADVNITFSGNLLTDSDGVCYQNAYPAGCSDYHITGISGTELFYGRWLIENAYGPETEDLPLQFQVEYYDAGGHWVRHSADNSTTYNATGIRIISSEITPLPSVSGSGTLNAGQPPTLTDSIWFSAPGVGNTGQIEFLFEQGAHLYIDENADGIVDEDDAPAATVNFGMFRGNDRIIHWREDTDG